MKSHAWPRASTLAASAAVATVLIASGLPSAAQEGVEEPVATLAETAEANPEAAPEATAEPTPTEPSEVVAALEEAVATKPVAGCEGACTVTAGEYVLRLPEGEGPFPAIMLLHNAGEDAEGVAASPLVDAVFLAKGYAVIAPRGLPKPYAGDVEESGWRLEGTETGGRDDLTFLETVLADAAARHGIDRDRVLLTGHGVGASLVWEAACLDPELASAYAPRDGGFWGALPEDCAAPVRLLHMHAPGAEGWPLTEAVDGADGVADQQPIQAHLALARAANGCGESRPIETSLPAGHDALGWPDCESASDLQLVLHQSAGHTTEVLMRHMLEWFAAGEATN
ncbi:MAG: polyhydroxybutyrate depolymerase [Pseudomonadota bacterium]